MLRQIFTIIRQARQFIFFDVLQRIRQRHISMRMVMTIGLAIRRHMHELPRVALGIEAAEERPGKILSTEKESLKCDRTRNRPVVIKQSDLAPRRQAAGIRPPRINSVFQLNPRRLLSRPKASGLAWGENGELDSLCAQKIQRFQVHRSFRQPHTLGIAFEPAPKVRDPPEDLRTLVAAV